MNGAVTDLVIASPLRRLAAYVIDYLIVSVIGVPVLIAFGDAIDISNPTQVSPTVLAIALAVNASYYMFFLCTMSMTFGKLAVGIYVSDRKGNRLRPDTAILRCVVYAVEQALLPLLLLSIILLFVDRRGRRVIHDRVAGTLVVVGRPPEVEPSGRRP